MMNERLIGRKDILSAFEAMYGVTTWIGALKFIRKNNLPLRRTPSGRPMFITAELVEYDLRFQELLHMQSLP